MASAASATTLWPAPDTPCVCAFAGTNLAGACLAGHDLGAEVTRSVFEKIGGILFERKPGHLGFGYEGRGVLFEANPAMTKNATETKGRLDKHSKGFNDEQANFSRYV